MLFRSQVAHRPRKIVRPLASSASLATSGGAGGGGWLSRRKATNPPAIRPSIIRKIMRETAGSMAEAGESGEVGSSADKGLALAAGSVGNHRDVSPTLQASPTGRQARPETARGGGRTG